MDGTLQAAAANMEVEKGLRLAVEHRAADLQANLSAVIADLHASEVRV